MEKGRTKLTSDDWSRSLRDDERWSSEDDEATSGLSRQQQHGARRGGAADDERGDAEDWSSLWSSRTDGWSDPIDIGAVEEPDSLKFFETPFTIAKRTGTSWAKGKGKEKGGEKPTPVPAPAAKSVQTAQQSTHRSSLSATKAPSTKPAPSTASVSLRPASSSPAWPEIITPNKVVKPVVRTTAPAATPKKPSPTHESSSSPSAAPRSAVPSTASKFRPAHPSTPQKSIAGPTPSTKSLKPAQPPRAAPIVLDLVNEDEDVDASSASDSLLGRGAAPSSQTIPTSSVPSSPSPPQFQTISIRPDSAASSQHARKGTGAQREAASKKPFVSPVRIGTGRATEQPGPSPRQLPNPTSQYQHSSLRPVSLAQAAAPTGFTTPALTAVSSAKKLDRFRHRAVPATPTHDTRSMTLNPPTQPSSRPRSPLPPPPASTSLSSSSTRPSRSSHSADSHTPATRLPFSSSTGRFTLPGLTTSSGKKGFKPAESLSSFRARVDVNGSRDGIKKRFREDVADEAREKVVFGAAIRSVRPSSSSSGSTVSSFSSFSPSTSTVGSRNRKKPRIGSIPLVTPRTTAPGVNEGHGETAEERLRRIYRSLDG